MSNSKLQTTRVLSHLPTTRNPIGNFPPELTGATIVRIGSPSDDVSIEGGGLIIDYKPARTDHTFRLVFGFNELGMWVESPPTEVRDQVLL